MDTNYVWLSPVDGNPGWLSTVLPLVNCLDEWIKRLNRITILYPSGESLMDRLMGYRVLCEVGSITGSPSTGIIQLRFTACDLVADVRYEMQNSQRHIKSVEFTDAF